MNGRRGPLVSIVSFTTTIIVNRRIEASKIKVYMFDLVYRELNLLMKVVWIGNFMFIDLVIIVRDIIDKAIDRIMCIIDRFWLGTIATKYENITNMPPM